MTKRTRTPKDSTDIHDQPLTEETPLSKQMREAAEAGEKLTTSSDSDIGSNAPAENAYEKLDEVYSVNVPLILPSFGGNETNQVYVYKCKMRDMGKIIRFAKLIIGEIGKFQKLDASEEHIDDSVQTEMILTVLSDHLEKTYDLVFDLCSIKDRAELDELDMDDGVELIMAIIEVNKRFFIQKVIPLITSMMGRNT